MTDTTVPGEVADLIDTYVTELVKTTLGLPTGSPEEIAAAVAFLSLAERYAALSVQLGLRHSQLAGVPVSDSAPGTGDALHVPGSPPHP